VSGSLGGSNLVGRKHGVDSKAERSSAARPRNSSGPNGAEARARRCFSRAWVKHQRDSRVIFFLLVRLFSYCWPVGLFLLFFVGPITTHGASNTYPSRKCKFRHVSFGFFFFLVSLFYFIIFPFYVYFFYSNYFF
jgi:hypothetical protein